MDGFSTRERLIPLAVVKPFSMSTLSTTVASVPLMTFSGVLSTSTVKFGEVICTSKLPSASTKSRCNVRRPLRTGSCKVRETCVSAQF